MIAFYYNLLFTFVDFNKKTFKHKHTILCRETISYKIFQPFRYSTLEYFLVIGVLTFSNYKTPNMKKNSELFLNLSLPCTSWRLASDKSIRSCCRSQFYYSSMKKSRSSRNTNACANKRYRVLE